MTFHWPEYLKLARELATPGVSHASGEARLCAAISRAYYAAFCTTRNHLRDKEGHRVPYGGQVHGYVINAFKSNLDRVRKQIGHDLDRLRIDRGKADYDDAMANIEATTGLDLTLAGNVISVLSLSRL